MIEGVAVGHWTDVSARTGCTVVLLPEGNVTSGEVRGGAPGTREFALLAPGRLVESVDAVVLTGGSAFGLAACDGVMSWLEERGRGFSTRAGRVPIVVGMVLFDLGVGSASVRPDAAAGRAACHAARTGALTSDDLGQIGAGTGLTVGGLLGPDRRRPGGIGMAVERHGDVEVAALVAVNAAGDVTSRGATPTGATPTSDGSGGVHRADDIAEFDPPSALTNTSVGVVVTNGTLDKVQCHLVAQAAHHGLARAVSPSHTRYDGDAFVASALGRVAADVDRVQAMATRAVEQAIVAAVAAAPEGAVIDPSGR